MFDSICLIAFWLIVGIGIGAIVGLILRCNSEFDRRMAELDTIIEELNGSVNDCIEARDRLTELTVNVYQQLKERIQ